MAKKNIVATVTELVAPVAQQLGYELWDVEFVKEGGTMHLRFTIDREGGVDITDCEKFHRAVDPVIDEADPIEQSYVMEVSSPGLERDIKYDRHFDACVGQVVEVSLYKPLNSQKKLRGTLLGLSDGVISLEIGGEVLKLPRADAARVNVYFDFTNI